MKPPVIVIPGITATSLTDFYASDPEPIWTILRRDYDRTALHPDDLRYERVEPTLTRATEAFSIPYDELVKELRHDLSPAHDRPRPVYLFAYDWRQPLHRTVGELETFIDEVAARTALLRHYARKPSAYIADTGRVDLVGHSMGGLVIAGYLARHGKRHRARKVITLGTPFRGSYEAVIKTITGTSGLDTGVPKSREREVARVTPALYHLLPDSGIEVEPSSSGLPRSLFQTDLWQRGVIESVAEHIRQSGLDPAASKLGRMAQARALLGEMLAEARSYRDAVDALRLSAVGLTSDDWMAVVGIGEETRIRLRVEDQGRRRGPWFDLTSLHRKNGYPMPVVEAGTTVAALEDTGDGTVPYWAAQPAFLDASRLVCVSTKDFGYWELKDRLLEWRTNLHSMLPAMNRVIKLCAAFLQSDAGRSARGHRGIRGRRSPSTLAAGAAWDPPFVGLEEEVPEGLAGLG